jgi:putative SOS response-associated peptidase YedK
MCGRFTLTSSGEQLARHFELDRTPELEPRYNIAPTQDVPVIRSGEGGNSLSLLRWGLVPFWAKDLSIGNRMINARAESAAEKPAFRNALRERRCIVPADGFYEWAGKRGQRQPYLFQLGDGEIFGIAGLWEHWKGPDRAVQSCTLITTEANSAISPIHHRMPAILGSGDYRRWLDPDLRDASQVLGLLAPCPPDWIRVRRVSHSVNDPRNEGPACVDGLREGADE